MSPQFVNIEAGAEPYVEPSIDELVQAAADAQISFDSLLEERRANRASMSKEAFRAYNAATHDTQLEKQGALDAANKALSRKRGIAEGQTIQVGTATEGNHAGNGDA